MGLGGEGVLTEGLESWEVEGPGSGSESAATPFCLQTRVWMASLNMMISNSPHPLWSPRSQPQRQVNNSS